MQNACVKYSVFLKRLVVSDLITLSELQASFHSLIGRLQEMKQVVHLWFQYDLCNDCFYGAMFDMRWCWSSDLPTC